MVILRDPVDRAYSHYNFSNRKIPASKQIDFYTALTRENEDRILADVDMLSPESKRFSYKTRGLYAKQLTVWFELFPRENFFIIETGKLKSQPEHVLKQLFDFLGLSKKDSIEFNQFAHHNKNTYPEMTHEEHEYLTGYFKDPNQTLFTLLGKSYPWK